jgi:hypothetical protein
MEARLSIWSMLGKQTGLVRRTFSMGLMGLVNEPLPSSLVRRFCVNPTVIMKHVGYALPVN